MGCLFRSICCLVSLAQRLGSGGAAFAAGLRIQAFEWPRFCGNLNGSGESAGTNFLERVCLEVEGPKNWWFPFGIPFNHQNECPQKRGSIGLLSKLGEAGFPPVSP